MDPTHAWNLASLARLLAYARDDHAAAHLLFLRAVRADPGDVSVVETYVDFLTAIRETDPNANRYFRDALEDLPECQKLLNAYGDFLSKVLGDAAEADRFFKRAHHAPLTI